MLLTFPEFIWNNTNIFRELLADSTAHTPRAYIKQYWDFQEVTGEKYYKRLQISCHYQAIVFQRVPSKLNYSKSFFQSSYHTILTLTYYLSTYYLTILTYSVLISNSIHTFTELLVHNSKHFFESFNGHLKAHSKVRGNFW